MNPVLILLLRLTKRSLIDAHLGRRRLGVLASSVSPLLDTRGRSVRRHAGSLAFVTFRRTAIGRRLLLGAAAASAAALVIAASAAVIAAQLLL